MTSYDSDERDFMLYKANYTTSPKNDIPTIYAYWHFSDEHKNSRFIPVAFLLQYFMNVSKYQSLLKLYLILRLGHTLWILGFCFINIQLANCTCKRKSMHNCFKIQQNFDLKSIVEEPIMILDFLAGNYSNLTEPYIIYSGRIYLSWAEKLVHITVRMILFIASRKNVF